MAQEPDNIISEIKSGSKPAFEKAFRQYYGALLNFAKGMLKDEDAAEEHVQEVFIKLWEMRDKLKPDLKLFPYLLTSVRNRCLNQVKHKQVEQKYINYTQKQYRDQVLSYSDYDIEDEIIEKLQYSITLLPDKCREVFHLSRFEGFSHKQIAEKLKISTKTVENHITKAMKIIRKELLVIMNILVILIGEL
ncbi:RNA polymerase sigma-70 factor [Fulvivirga sp. M361]|uniref:RNA polymerase sigma-70 factor n=1 Tax=Fulvivirga sp. M361 TaxID=2594266 RepID=UPI00162A833E|nr:RNA polymerase sigma-70 factor [Fulvivirga sp. M361]